MEEKRGRGRPRTGDGRYFRHDTRFNWSEESKFEDLCSMFDMSKSELLRYAMLQLWYQNMT